MKKLFTSTLLTVVAVPFLFAAPTAAKKVQNTSTSATTTAPASKTKVKKAKKSTKTATTSTSTPAASNPQK
jgi:hypothetical protein